MDNQIILSQLINTVPQYIFWKDRSGVFRGCNLAFAKQFGFESDKEIIGKTDFDFYWAPTELQHKYVADDQAVMNSGIPKLNYEEEQGQPDGSIKTILINKVPVYDENKQVVGILGTYLDITELKKAQQDAVEARAKAAAEEATTRAILIFSGMATHDLRTPLSSANLRAAFIKKHEAALVEGYKAALQANLEVPYIQPKVLEDLIKAPDDILQAVREANTYIDASLKSIKGASLGEELLKADQLVECQTERLFQRIKNSYPYKEGAQCLLHIDSSYDFKFMGNEIYFNRLIENLIKNAFEQIQLKGKGEIFIHCEAENSLNLIKIKDTAGGVTQNVVESLFSGIGSSKHGGTGVGLSSAKQVMRAMGGGINCHIVDGDCIEFVLSFPAF